MATLSGKTALVTGGSRSLGKAIALRLADMGASVVITYRTQAEQAAETVAAIHAKGQRATALQVDLTTTEELDALIARFRGILKEWSVAGFDILINNAGITSHTAFSEMTEEDVDRLYGVNFKSVFFLTQRLLDDLNDGGTIINIGSGTTRFVVPHLAAYAALKGAVEVFTRYLARALGPRQITVNVVSPGALDTDFNADIFASNPGITDYLASVTALGRVGLASDVDGVVGFLCTEEARWITGQRLEVSGGMFL